MDGSCTTEFTGTPEAATALYPNGMIKASLLDVSSGYMSGNRFASQEKLIAYYTTNVANTVNGSANSYVIDVRPSGPGGLYSQTDLTSMQSQDAALVNNLKSEYCHYYSRYKYSLTTFLSMMSSDPTTAKTWLEAAITLNKRLNALVELVDYLAKSRISFIQGSVNIINDLNTQLSGVQDELNGSYRVLTQDNAIITTQKEMIKYTLQKNNHISNQISLWATLNILAIATIFVVYRRM